MTWKELSDKIEKLSDEQKQMTVKGWSEETPISDAVFCIDNEHYYCNYDADWDCCYRESELEKEDLEDENTHLVLEANVPYIFFG